MFIKYAGSGAALLLMILVMIIKYNSEKTKLQNKKKEDVKLKNEEEFWGYGQFIVIDEWNKLLAQLLILSIIF